MREGVIAKLRERLDVDGGEFGALWVIVGLSVRSGSA